MRARLTQRNKTENHVEGQHVDAMVALGEAASGAAVAGAFVPVILKMHPMAEITYRKFARGTLTATAQTSRPGAELLAEIQSDCKIAFDVAVDLRDAVGDTVVEMKLNWYVSRMQI
jgi:hypothetical protein